MVVDGGGIGLGGWGGVGVESSGDGGGERGGAYLARVGGEVWRTPGGVGGGGWGGEKGVGSHSEGGSVVGSRCGWVVVGKWEFGGEGYVGEGWGEGG
jgi:hypothetical protein